jgi:hypothetical protein
VFGRFCDGGTHLRSLWLTLVSVVPGVIVIRRTSVVSVILDVIIIRGTNVVSVVIT